MQGWLPNLIQEPVLRTSCHRVAFQSSTSDLLRVSIDTDLTFTKARAYIPVWKSALTETHFQKLSQAASQDLLRVSTNVVDAACRRESEGV